jgi:hypothetical protein
MKDAAGTSLDGTADSAKGVLGQKTLAHIIYAQLKRPPTHVWSQHGLFTLD